MVLRVSANWSVGRRRSAVAYAPSLSAETLDCFAALGRKWADSRQIGSDILAHFHPRRVGVFSAGPNSQRQSKVHRRHPLSCPGRAATPFALQRRAGTQGNTVQCGEMAPALQRTAKRRCAASGARERNSFRIDFQSQTHLRILAADFTRALLRLSTLSIQEGAGKAGCRLAPTVRCAKAHAEELHSGIQVKPNTRPSLRSGLTAYAVLSREPNSFWPPSPREIRGTAPVDANAASARA